MGPLGPISSWCNEFMHEHRNVLAGALKVSPRQVNELVLGECAVSEDTDSRLARHFGMPEGIVLCLQAQPDLREQERKLGPKLAGIQPRAA